MTYSTYFEVGGHVLEHHLNRPELPGRPAATGVKVISERTGVPAPLVRKAAKQFQKDTGYDPVRAAGAHGRFRRARWAFTTAATLAAVDGPLPVGDALAIGLLAGYGAYETVSAIQDILQ
jgi:hypothetical protein